MVFLIIYPCAIHRLFSNPKLEEKNYKNKYGEFFANYRDPKYAFLETMSLIRKFILSAVLVFLGESPSL